MSGGGETARKAKYFDNTCRYRAHAGSCLGRTRPCGGGADPAPHRHERHRSAPSPFLGCRAADSRQKGSGKVPASGRDVFESPKTFPPTAGTFPEPKNLPADGRDVFGAQKTFSPVAWAFLGSFRLISRPRTRSQAPAEASPSCRRGPPRRACTARSRPRCPIYLQPR